MAEKRYKEIDGVRYEILPNPDLGSNLLGSGGSLPEIESGDGGKVLTVNDAETGTEWASIPAPSGVIMAPASPSDGDFLVYSSEQSKWVAQSLSTWTAGSY